MSARELAHKRVDELPDWAIDYLIEYIEGLTAATPEEMNAETIAAIREAEEMKKNPELYPGYTDVDEMMKELLS